MKSLLNKFAVLQACNFIKKRLQHRGFTVNIAKFLRAFAKGFFWNKSKVLYNHGTIIPTIIIPPWCNRSVLNKPQMAQKWLHNNNDFMVVLYTRFLSLQLSYHIGKLTIFFPSEYYYVAKKVKYYKQCLKLSKLNILPLGAFYTVPNYFVKHPHPCSPKAVFTQVISTMPHLQGSLQQLHLGQKIL